MILENDNQIIENEAQADELLESIEQPQGEATPEVQQTQTPTQSFPDEYAFTVGGKEIKGSWSKERDKVIKWAQMGYEAPNRIGSLTKEIETWKAKESQYKEMDSKYGEIDKYVRQNPDFWQHVTDSYSKRQQTLNDTSNPLAATVNELRTQVQDLLKFKEGTVSERTQIEQAREYETLVSEIEGVQKQYPKIDFATPDADGKSLEYKVLEYAKANKIGTFKTAFRDFYHDELIKMHAEQAKESVVKERQKQTRLGLLGTTQTPTQGQNRTKSIRDTSHDDIADEIKRELGIA